MKHRKIKEIANDIKNLAERENYDYEAFYNYLYAMLELDSIHDMYGMDRGGYIVKAFMGNIRYWKHKDIKPLREELKSIIKEYDKN